MGLFDKLKDVANVAKEVANTAKNSIDSAIEAKKQEELMKFDPFDGDATKRKYYEIAYGLLASHKRAKCYQIKKYVEYNLGSSCEDKKLQEVLNDYFTKNWTRDQYHECYEFLGEEFFRKRAEDYSSGYKEKSKKILRLIEINKELDEIPTYRCTKEEMYDICDKELLENIENAYKEVIDVLEQCGAQHFENGIENIKWDYKRIVLREALIDEILWDITKRYLLNGNEMVLEGFYGLIDGKFRKYKEEKKGGIVEKITSIALRAVHFEKNDKAEDEYTTITKEECTEFVANDNYYIGKINEDPFYRSVSGYVSCIYKDPFYESYRSDYWFPTCEKSVYSLDKLCNFYCKDLIHYYGNTIELDDVSAVSDMLASHVSSL